MKTRYKHIEFSQIGGQWRCLNIHQRTIIGSAEYVLQWQKWEYVPHAGTGYTSDCLRDIAQFLDHLKEDSQ